MRSLEMRHPEGEQLLRYADGELGSRAAGRVREHLEACWQCRLEIEEIQRVAGECVRYRKDVWQAHLPPPPAPWADLRRRMAEADAALEPVSLARRMAQAVARLAGPARRWAPAAVALALVAAIIYQFQNAPSVRAAALLRKAVAAEARREGPRRIQIRTRQQRLTRVIGARAGSVPQEAGAAPLEALFAAAHYSWEDPLSARSYAAWREQLADRRDEVTSISGRPGGYRIRTTTQSGVLQEAVLRLDARDYRPVEERLEFRNREWVEITVLDEGAAAEIAGEVNREERIAPTLPPAPHPAAAAPAAKPPATVGDELRVLAALHQVGADLGDPIEVRRSGSQILVSGVGVGAERQQRIQEALAAMPRVVIRFAEPAAGAPPARPGGAEAVRAEAPGLQARMEEQLGGRAFFEQLAGQALDMSDAVMSRIYALRRLADRFPSDAAAGLSSQDQELLRQMVQEHTGVLARQTVELQRLLNPVLSPLAGPAATAARSALSAGAWQPATEELFREARHTETLLAALFAAAPPPVPEARLPAELLESLTQLRAGAEAYERLLSQPGGRTVE